MKIRTLFHVLYLSACIYLYILFYRSIPGSGWNKRLIFGLIIGVMKHTPEAFNQWTLIVYPGQLILLQLINGVLSLVIFGALLAIILEKSESIKILEKI